MIYIDTLLQKLHDENKPIRLGLVGSGFMAKGFVNQIARFVKGIEIVAVANRTPEKARKLFVEAGYPHIKSISSSSEIEGNAKSKVVSLTDDPTLLTDSSAVDVIVEMTGAVEHGLQVITKALKNHKTVVSYNAELDATLGSYLVRFAREHDAMYTIGDGDQPGVEMNLFRYVKGLGVTPVLCGNIKGLQDPYRTPTTQKDFAEKWGQNPYMVTSFADGSKISFEQACVANAVGFQVAKRGMHGFKLEFGTKIEETAKLYDIEEIKRFGGIVDYVVGAVPNGGIFVLATTDDPVQKHYLKLYKVGEGPLYCFFAPYHLCHFELPSSIARAFLLKDITLMSQDKPKVEVITRAKCDLKKGQKLDSIGGYLTYGECENAPVARTDNLLPLGLADGCTVKHDLPKDSCITLNDVELNKDLLSTQLWLKEHNLN
jgi:predicted homoserine dehydrogenase-like protein